MTAVHIEFENKMDTVMVVGNTNSVEGVPVGVEVK